jgi:TolA-binding protein
MRTMLRNLSRLLLLGLLVVMVAACGGDALRQCEETVAELESQNQVLKEAFSQSQIENQLLQQTIAQSQTENQELEEDLTQSQIENQQLQEALADAQAEVERLRGELSQEEPDLSWVPERLWILFHDDTPALWACDDTASRVVPMTEMPSVSPAEMVQELNDWFIALNPQLESPGLALEGIDGDTAVVSLAQSNVVTEQMGSTGAQCYFAGVTFSLTSFETIDHVRFEIKEGSHGGPGRYDRTDFVYFLPLELDQP